MTRTHTPPSDHAILGIIAQLAPIAAADIKSEHRLREDLGLDSVSSMELLSMLSEELGLDLEIEDALGITTVGDVLQMTRARLGGGPGDGR